MKTSGADFPEVVWGEMELLGISHYHQRGGVQPVPHGIPPGRELVELVTGGRGWVRDGDTWREVVPGHLLWHGPGAETIGRSDLEAPYRCLAVNLKTDRKKGLGIPRFSLCPDPEVVKAFTDEVVKCFFDPAFDRRVLLRYVVSRLLFWVHGSRFLQRRAELPEAVGETLEWIDRNYARPCRVEELAKRVGWSAAHLHYTFRLHLGKSPHKMLMARRLRAAQEALASTGHPIKRVAVESGFADASALIHAFRATQGITPTAYRKRYIGPMAKGA